MIPLRNHQACADWPRKTDCTPKVKIFALSLAFARTYRHPRFLNVCCNQMFGVRGHQCNQHFTVIPHRVIQLTTISFWVLRDKAAPSTSQHKSTNKQIPFEASEEPSDTVSHFYFCFFLHLQESSALSQSEKMIVQ